MTRKRPAADARPPGSNRRPADQRAAHFAGGAAADPAAAGQAALDARADEAVRAMSLEEKVSLMTGSRTLLGVAWEFYVRRHYNNVPFRTHAVRRLGIPPLAFADGPRGSVMGHATCFPAAIARGASFDRELEERVGEAIGLELRAGGANLYGGVCINLLRHPAWGRAQETFGEDPYHVGELGAALVRGVQRQGVMACVKHFALNSIENSRFFVDVKCSPRTLREVFLPHFKRCIDEGAASIMAAYNRVEGEYCCENRMLLTEILRAEWGFRGFTVSDFFNGVHDTVKAATSGLDVEMPVPRWYGRRLVRAVRRGEVAESTVDEAARRIVRALIAIDRGRGAARPPRRVIACRAHRELAREAAEQSIVLLRNEGVLPLDRAALRRVAVLGRLATRPNLGDHGSSRVYPPRVTTLRRALRAALPDARLLFGDERDLPSAVDAARAADAAIVVVGSDFGDEGEFMPERAGTGGDRASLRLRAAQVELIRAAARANPRVIVVVIGGGAVIMNEWQDEVAAILFAFYPGMEGGAAIARILLGEVCPSGRLPFSIAHSEQDYPPFDSTAPEVRYGPDLGYMLLDKSNRPADFPFGFGLSYTRFAYRELRATAGRDDATITITVENHGPVAGREVVQLYTGWEGSAVERPARQLRAFSKVSVEPGAARTLEFRIRRRELARYDERSKSWVDENVGCVAYVGSSSRASDLLSVPFRFAEA